MSAGGNVMLVLTLIFWVWKYQVWSHVSHGVKFSHENIRFGWHLSHVRCHGRENIRGRGHILCPGHCRPGASKPAPRRARRDRRAGQLWELNRAENILPSMWTFRSWWTLILIMRGNNVTLVSERWMQRVEIYNALGRNVDMCVCRNLKCWQTAVQAEYSKCTTGVHQWHLWVRMGMGNVRKSHAIDCVI